MTPVPGAGDAGGLVPVRDGSLQHMNNLCIQAAMLNARPFGQRLMQIVRQAQKNPNEFGHNSSVHHLDTTPLSCYYQYITRVSE